MNLRVAASFLAISTLGVNASYEKIAGYEPNSNVIDINALDLDQAFMETALSEKNDEGFAKGKKIYMMGGNSMSYAEIAVTALPADVAADTDIKGMSVDGDEIMGKTHGALAKGATIVKFRYPTLEVQENHVKCKVGGLPEADQTRGGCLAATGKLTIGGTDYDYTYDVATGNKNAGTIQGLSTSAGNLMNNPEAKKYTDYYGVDDFADKWVTAGLEGKKVDFADGRSFDFTKYGFDGRVEVVKKGTVYLNFYMTVIGKMHEAVNACKAAKETHAWDEAVAYYTGSLEGQTGEGESSKLLHQVADKRCANFATCGENADSKEGLAQANRMIFKEFKAGQANLGGKKCDDLMTNASKITAIMAVPMVQGALRYAYRVDNEPDGLEKKNAEGVIFSVAVLPRVNACDPQAAKTILDQMQVMKDEYTTDFPTVKKTFESVYKCMGINCAQIGGLIDVSTDKPYAGAEPCEGGAKEPGVVEEMDSDSSPASFKTATVALATTLGAFAAYSL